MKFFFRNSTVIAFCKPPSRSTQYHATSVSHSKKINSTRTIQGFLSRFPLLLFLFPLFFPLSSLLVSLSLFPLPTTHPLPRGRTPPFYSPSFSFSLPILCLFGSPFFSPSLCPYVLSPCRCRPCVYGIYIYTYIFDQRSRHSSSHVGSVFK